MVGHDNSKEPSCSPNPAQETKSSQDIYGGNWSQDTNNRSFEILNEAEATVEELNTVSQFLEQFAVDIECFRRTLKGYEGSRGRRIRSDCLQYLSDQNITQLGHRLCLQMEEGGRSLWQTPHHKLPQLQNGEDFALPIVWESTWKNESQTRHETYKSKHNTEWTESVPGVSLVVVMLPIVSPKSGVQLLSQSHYVGSSTSLRGGVAHRVLNGHANPIEQERHKSRLLYVALRQPGVSWKAYRPTKCAPGHNMVQETLILETLFQQKLKTVAADLKSITSCLDRASQPPSFGQLNSVYAIKDLPP